MRVSFSTIFTQHPDGSLEPRQRIRVGGVALGPGVRFSRGAVFGGIDFHQFIGHDFEVETDGDVTVIKGIY
jgi:hypothetical protein